MARDADKLNIGCGGLAPDDFVNLDGSWNALLSKVPGTRSLLRALRLIPAGSAAASWKRDVVVKDVANGLPFPEGRFSAVYSRMIHHLHRSEADEFLKECLRVLRPGGVVRVQTLDFRNLVLEYLGDSPFDTIPEEMEDRLPADRFLSRLRMRAYSPNTSHNAILRWYYSATDFHSYRWVYDEQSLRFAMERAGFVGIERKGYLESAIPGIARVEVKDRFTTHKQMALEGFKPAND